MDGTILSNTENIGDVEWDSDLNHYIISIEGVNYNNNNLTTIISPITDDVFWVNYGTNSIENKLIVQFYTDSVSVQRKFHFVKYQYQTTPIITNEKVVHIHRFF